MAIKHNSYFDGNVQSLGATNEDGDFTVGILLPGEYEFPAERYEDVSVITGLLIDGRDGKRYPDGMDLPRFKPGETVKLSCTEPTAYLCEYSDEE